MTAAAAAAAAAFGPSAQYGKKQVMQRMRWGLPSQALQIVLSLLLTLDGPTELLPGLMHYPKAHVWHFPLSPFPGITSLSGICLR